MSNALDKQVGGNHYKKFAIQPLEFLSKNNIPFSEGSIIKYILREKNNRLEDLEKAKHILEYLIELEKQKETK